MATEADENKVIVRQAIEQLEIGSTYLENLDQHLTEIGADLNELKVHLGNSLRSALTALAQVRSGTEQASLAMRGSQGLGPEAISMLQTADTDLQDLVKALSLIQGWIKDAQTGPHRTSTEERPRILGKVRSAIARLESYFQVL